MSNEITVERVPHSGALILTALTRDYKYPELGEFYHSKTYYGYEVEEALILFEESLDGFLPLR